MLAEIPEDNLLERLSLDARLRSAKFAIEGIPEPQECFKAKLTFQGKPVFGCHGIVADFGSKASGLFSEVVTAIAVGLTDDLKNNIHESTQKYEGEFQGVLPSSRTFEFRCADNAAIIKGKIGQNIAAPSDLNRNYLYKPVRVRMHIIQFGTGKPRYLLFSIDDVEFIAQ